MKSLHYVDDRLHFEDVPLESLALRYGTPCYVYSRAQLEHNWRAYDAAFASFDHLVCFAVKANSNLGVLDVLARLGSGFDIVSQGELERVVSAGGLVSQTVFSGVGKSADEMRSALAAGIMSINVESAAELRCLDQVARGLGVQAPVSLRVNPDVDAKTHPYISTGLKENKFGVPIEDALALYMEAQRADNLLVSGIDCHIGSQLTSVDPFVAALDIVLGVVDTLSARGCHLKHLNLGGGIGIRYKDETPPTPAQLGRAIHTRINGRPLKLLFEPGRAIAGDAGILLTRVRYLKRNGDKHFAVVDAAMNDLLRPALYQAWQDVVPLNRERNAQRQSAVYDVVGPVCESADFLATKRELDLAEDDVLAVKAAGAYGFVMSSNYNTRPRAAEVMVDGDASHVVRAREQTRDLFALEAKLP